MAFIYKIENKVNGKVYIGKTRRTDVTVRWKEHISMLFNNNHPNVHLLNAWNTYGFSNFTFSIIAQFPEDYNEEELAKQEIKYIDKFDSLRNGYNLKPESINGLKLKKWHYTISKNGKTHNNKQSYCIRDRNGDYLITSIDKKFLEGFLPLLNSNEKLGLKKIADVDRFKFSVVKHSKSSSGKMIYSILDREDNSLICSIDKDLLNDFALLLNSDEEAGLKSIQEYKESDKFIYTVANSGILPSGNQDYTICGRQGNKIINSINRDYLLFVCNLLNSNENEWIIEEEGRSKLRNKKLLKELFKNYDYEVLV